MLPAFLCLAACTSPSAPVTSRLGISAWLVYWDEGKGLAAFEKHAAKFNCVMPEWIGLTMEGEPFRRTHHTPEQKKRTFEIARKNGVAVYAMVSNFVEGGFNAKPVQAFLHDPAKRKAHARKLAQMAKEDGFDGVELDYESLEAKDREAFSDFVDDLDQATRALKLRLSIAVHPKTSEPGTWGGTISQDWKRLGKAVDEFRIMTYDQHWSTSEAGPVASRDFVRSVLEFAVTQVDPKRIEMGIPAYGYDWQGKQGRTVTWSTWTELLAQHGPAKRHESGELTLTYSDRTVFFPDAQAQVDKLADAKKLKIGGVAVWVLGSEDPTLWDVLDRNR